MCPDMTTGYLNPAAVSDRREDRHPNVERAVVHPGPGAEQSPGKK